MGDSTGWIPQTLATIASVDPTAGTVIVAGTPAPYAGQPQYTIFIKYARIIIRSITGGAVTVGGDTTANSPVILKGVDVGEYILGPLDGLGLPLTDNVGISYIASGSSLDYSIQLSIIKKRNDLG